MNMKTDVLRSYVDEESDELILELQRKIEGDGYTSTGITQEALALRVLALATVKILAIMCERTNHSNIALAHVQMAPMTAELVKDYVMRARKVGAGR